ncbi:MAG: CdaR family protein [Nitrospirota bacterium]
MDARAIFIENRTIKLASLVLAVTLWFYVTSRGKTEMSLTVPLELRNIPQDMAVVGDIPGSIEVRLQGQERALRDIASGKKVVGIVDLGRGKAGENIVRLSPDDIRKPSGALVTRLVPYEITVTLDRLTRKTLRLRPVFTGRPAPGYRVTNVLVSPVRVTLEGPAQTIRRFTVLQTMPIDVSGMHDNTTVEPRIDFQGQPVKVLERDIGVTITFRKERP